MNIIHCPEPFFGCESPIISICFARPEDIEPIERFVMESPRRGTVLLSEISDLSDNSPEVLHWIRAAKALSSAVGLIISDYPVSIFQAGASINDPMVSTIGTPPDSIRRNLIMNNDRGEITPEDFLRFVEDEME